MTDRMGTAMDMRDAKKGIRTLWSWLRGASWSIDRDTSERRESSRAASAGPSCSAAPAAAGSEPHAVTPVVGHLAAPSGVLLRFPVRGEALLVKLADLLQSRTANRGLERDPLLLLISRCPGSRLSIDRAAYVEFLADRCTYYVAIEAQPDTRVTLETTDFDTVVKFVVQYVAERLSEPVNLDVAS
jgi:hypothetical protein